MIDKKFIVKSLLTTVLTIIVMFLLNQWLGSFRRDMSALRTSIDASTVVTAALDDSIDELRLQMTRTDAQIAVKFENIEKVQDDHETRIRELERTP